MKYEVFTTEQASADLRAIFEYIAYDLLAGQNALNQLDRLEQAILSLDMENIKKVPKNLPLFFVSGADDPVGDLGEGVKKVYGMYKDAGVSDITYRLYEDDRHEILNETDRDQVMADIAAWLNVHVEL